MSEALDYLMKARPEAMQAYFKFLKLTGQRLDPRTRAIISVITKVDSQTPAGFRQYLKRALKEGVSGPEILDALLLAFPSLGLTKIIWAIDQLLQMNLPEFILDDAKDEQADQPEWRDLVRLSNLQPEQTHCFPTNGRHVFVRVQDAGAVVWDGICPHRQVHFNPGDITGDSVVCRGHGHVFDLRTGRSVNADESLTRLESRVNGDYLQIRGG